MLLALSMCIGLSLFSQSIGVGVSSFSNTNTRSSSNTGIHLSVGYKSIYIDYSSNWSTGNGKELNYSSSYSYPTNKKEASVVNLGYRIKLNKYVSLIPTIGYGWTRDIYEDPILFQTYFYDKPKNFTNFGGILEIKFAKNFGVYWGLGSFEQYKAGLSYTIK